MHSCFCCRSESISWRLVTNFRNFWKYKVNRASSMPVPTACIHKNVNIVMNWILCWCYQILAICSARPRQLPLQRQMFTPQVWPQPHILWCIQVWKFKTFENLKWYRHDNGCKETAQCAEVKEWCPRWPKDIRPVRTCGVTGLRVHTTHAEKLQRMFTPEIYSCSRLR